MVTATTSGSVGEQKRPPRKKPMITGIWPCKINGCNKQFAREADLKRHQRTTKMHSMPSFSCPQCDANFTRTDALRRHQKSRHNGVVIEPSERNGGGDENVDGRSRSGTPSSKGKERELNNIPVQTHQGAPTHTGPSSYYRSHTVTISPHLPQQPTSSRTGPPWSEYSTSWQNGSIPPNMGPMGYVQYYPSPHYRPHTNGYHTGTTSTYQPQAQPLSSSSTSTSRNSSLIPPNSSSSRTSASHSQSPPIVPPDAMSGPNPSNLELQTETGLTEADVVAAVQAVLSMQAESEEAAEKQRLKELEERSRTTGGGIPPRDTSPNSNRDSVESPSILLDLDDHGMLHDYARPEPMEHILTEDGEPMLNPAELLTQESLASPPPS